MNAFSLWTHFNFGGVCFLPLGLSYMPVQKYSPGVILDRFNDVAAYWGTGIIVMNCDEPQATVHMGRRDS